MQESALLPLAIRFRDRQCVCVGAGAVAARRVPALIEAGARVTVIAPDLHLGLARLREAGRFEHVPLRYAAGHVAGAFFVLAATGIQAVDEAVATEALQSGALVCVAGDPALGNCQFMATTRRGALLIGVQTAGVAPAVSAALRRHIEGALPDNLEEILEQIGDLRIALRAAEPDARERARRWQRAAESGAIDALLRGDDATALDHIRALLFS
jgi:siroheme synthase-like protein